MSAITQVKGIEAQIIHVAQCQGFHLLEASIGAHGNGECVSGVPGANPVAGWRTVYAGTWDNLDAPKGSHQGAGKVVEAALPLLSTIRCRSRRYAIAFMGVHAFREPSRGAGCVKSTSPVL